MDVDPQLIRLILLTVEKASYPLKGRIGPIAVQGYDQEIIDEHIEELRKAGILDANVKRSRAKAGGPVVGAEVKHLTETGWRLVETLKRNDVWDRAVKSIGNSQLSLHEVLAIVDRAS